MRIVVVAYDTASDRYTCIVTGTEGRSIVSHTLKSPKIVTLKDIAARCGVTQNTVSVALRGKKGEVSPAVRDHILRVAAEMGYDPIQNDGARRLAQRRGGVTPISQVIGVFFPPHFSHFRYFSSILQGILDICTDESFGVLMSYLPDNPPFALPPIFGRGDIDAVICIAHHRIQQCLVEQLRHNPVFGSRPIISLIRPCDGCSAVLTDDISGEAALATHLLELGHRHLVYFRGIEEDYPSTQRLRGIRQAYHAHGLDPDVYLHLVVIDYDQPREQGMLHPLLALLRARPEITAILAPHDQMARDIFSGLTHAGYRIPEDISLVGYDDAEEVQDANGVNILTTMRLPLVELGSTATTLAIDQIRTQLTTPVDHCLVPTLVVRQSTAPPSALQMSLRP